MIREPIYRSTSIKDLRPTQITIGMREVSEKRRRWREKHGSKAGEFIATHMIPVVLGPKERPYVIDNHHLARALYDDGVVHVATTTILDLSRLEAEAFWIVMDDRGWMHPFDEHGQRQHYDKIPKSLKDLKDDPYRSIAGELRRIGGYAKDTTPFSEFLWADFLRRHIGHKEVKEDYALAVEEALRLAKSRDANYLPGWCGPVDD
jgi:hypothetical protein